MTRPEQEIVLRLEAAEKEREMDEERIADLMALKNVAEGFRARGNQ